MVCPCMEDLKLNLQGLHPSTQPQHNNGASLNPQDVFGRQPGMQPFQFNASQHGQDRQVKIQMNLAFQISMSSQIEMYALTMKPEASP